MGLHPKTSSYLKDSNDECKKAKCTKKCILKRKLKFKDCKNCLKTSQIVNIVNYVEKKRINVDGLKEDKKFHEKEVIIKSQQRFKSRRYVFTGEINKITLSSNHDKKYNHSILLRHTHME